MKTKTKLMATAVALLAATGAAVGTSSFAWFVAAKSASISAGVFSAVTTEGSIAVTVSATQPQSTAAWTMTGTNVAPATGQEGYAKLTDVSGLGNVTAFYKAYSFTADATKAKSKLVNDPSDGKGMWANFNLEIENKASSAMDIYLGSTTDVANVTVTDAKGTLYKAARVKISASGDDVTNAASFVFGASGDSAANKATTYCTEAKTTQTLLADLAATASVFSGITTWKDSFTTTTNADPVAEDKLCTIVGSKKGTVNVVIWIEGMDAECTLTGSTATSDILKDNFQANLQFIGNIAA